MSENIPFNGILAFTGTRDGMTRAQQDVVEACLAEWQWSETHHGCCVGADAQFALASRRIRPGHYMTGFPSTLTGLTSHVAPTVCDEMRPPRPPLDRNKDIVEACDRLIAAPRERAEQQRSGTWATIRYARKLHKPLVIVWPDGSMTGENMGQFPAPGGPP